MIAMKKSLFHAVTPPLQCISHVII